MRLQPGVGRLDVALEQLSQKRVKCRRMIEMREVSDLMRDDGAAHQLGTVTGDATQGYTVTLEVPVTTT